MSITHKSIAISSLLISTDNPRFEIVPNQREAISVMVKNQGSKLIKLAKDILEFGLNPTKYICVTPNPHGSGQYIVLEGNRRITALKILNNPAIVDEHQAGFLKSMKKLSETFHKKPMTDIACAVFPDTESALRWIELEHTGENEGVGVVDWDGQQRARFDKKVKGVTPLALQALELMQRSAHTPKKVKDSLPSLTITNLERLLGDPDVRDVLGIKLQDKNLYTDLAEVEVIKGLSKIATDFLFNEYTVYDINKKKDRKEYLESFNKSEIPDKTNKSDGPWHLITEPPKKSSTESKTTNKRSGQQSQDRTKLIPRDCIMDIKDTRLNAIYRELKDMDVDEFVNASAVLLRVFLELSIDSLIRAKNGKAFQGISKGTSLKEKVNKTIKYFEDSSSLDDQEVSAIKGVVQNPDGIFSIDTLHAYVHNPLFHPIGSELKITWDNIQIFVEKIWEAINKTK